VTAELATRISLGALAATFGLAAAAFAAKPEAVKQALARFPRSRRWGLVLAALAYAGAAAAIWDCDLGRFDAWKPALVPLAGVSWWATVAYLDELLAPRALGGLLLLAPAPWLAAIRWADVWGRNVLSAAIYVCIVAGGFLVAAPWTFRKTAEALCANAGKMRATALVLSLLATLFAVLAFV
jgi:hypothetical protein